jgi:hypothetical protein
LPNPRSFTLRREDARKILWAVVFILPCQLFAWGAKGHEITARAACKALPADVPAFFRQACGRFAYLVNEPDRWKASRESALEALNPPDHYFDLEFWGDAKLPSTRYEFLLEAVKRGLISDTKPVANMGTAPWVVGEYADRLVIHIRQWHETREDTEASQLVRRQVEENIIYTAGVLAHFVTDLGNPLHCTIHHNGWREGSPNPRGYLSDKESRSLHARFESIYLERAVDDKDMGALPAPRRVGPWVAETEQFIRRQNTFVEKLYALEAEGSFGSGKETPEARSFLLARLGDAASMLRDYWSTAWIAGGEQWLTEPVMTYGRTGSTALDLLRNRRVETQSHELGKLVVAIGNRRNGLDGRYWHYYVNGQMPRVSADKYQTNNGDRIEWRFEKAGGGRN